MILGSERIISKITIQKLEAPMSKDHLSVAKVIEVIAQGKTIENAIENAALKAHETVRNVKQVNVENIQAIVENGKVAHYRVNAKVTFIID
jgi:flavin-binding protein dodecin